MAFPTDPLDVKVELELDGTWSDVTDYVYTRSPIQITRGRQDEQSTPGASKCALVLNNRDGRFSSRNPSSTYYGLIGRNTPIRVSTLVGPTRLVAPTALTDYMSAPDSAALSITGDLDLRVDVRVLDWTHGGRFVTKYIADGSQRSYVFDSNSAGKLVLFWSTDGAGTGVKSATSTVPVPSTTGRQTVRATLDVDNGASGHTVTFYTGESVDGPWTQLGDAVVQSGTTSIFNGTADVRTSTIGGTETYAVKILDGIDGTEVANPDFTVQVEGDTSFDDDAGNTWTIVGDAELTARRYRFHGEVASWPQAWDLSGNDVWVEVEASGIFRRLGQGADPLLGTIQRATLNDENVRGYWPMEDGIGATSIGSGLPGGPPMVFTGSPRLASSDVFLASNPVLEAGLASFAGAVNTHTATGVVHARCLMAVPSGGESDNSVVMRMFTTGTASRWDFLVQSDGALTLQAFDSEGTNLLDLNVGFRVNGVPCVLVMELVQDGSDIDFKMLTIALSDGQGLSFSGTLSSRTVGAATNIQINPAGQLDETALGHVAVASAIPSGITSPFRGYAGETASARVERLCGEQGITFTGYGDPDLSAAMGAQKPDTLMALLTECEASDLGQVFESRDSLGISYRTRDSRQYQHPALALDYGNLSELVPVEDDQATRNDVTVSRKDGASARIVVTEGPLSVNPPPDGVGRYKVDVPVSLEADSQCADQASWRAAVGTVDEARYPSVRVRLETSSFSGSAALTDQALSVEHGDLITIEGLPTWMPPDDVRQHTIGQVETLGVFSYGIEFVCEPATPAGSTGLYDIESRYDTAGSSIGEDLTTTETDVTVGTSTGPVWTQDSGDLPFDVMVGGERMTVTTVSGTTSPQTFTVIRSVNGVVKAHSSGADVRLAEPTYYAL